MQQIRQAVRVSKPNWLKTACAVCVVCAATSIALPAQTFTTLHRFHGADGELPYATLVQATSGNLYGTTSGGGANQTCFLGCGTVFTITPAGSLTTIYSFCSQGGSSCTDGDSPSDALVQATDGNLYGTTSNGGANASDCGGYGCGTVFKITLGGTLTTLYSFCSQSGCTDGAYPVARLVQATDGDLYGTTSGGGANSSCFGGFGCGTVFKITPSGALMTLYNFCSQGGCADGYDPQAGLVQASDGNFYGTMVYGGANGYGTVFRITPSGTLTTLYNFCAQGGICADGAVPQGALVQASDGNLYGTTGLGGADNGCSSGCGTVFEISPGGALTTLFYNFCLQSGCADGAFPVGALAQGVDGNFYGTTNSGGVDGPNGYGTIFEITPNGALTTLHSFCSQSRCADGSTAVTGVVQDTNGTFYGTTSNGGVNNNTGTVFSLSVGLGPFVETLPTATKVGAGVRILGTNLTGATSVTFNGTAATFTVRSSSFIAATVPVGATTGRVEVVTLGGTLTSNVPFRVLP
jgi:uncharacterized repeat protein (TIGR03803 family)